MKAFIFLLFILASCSVDDTNDPPPVIDCKHLIEYNEYQKRVELHIISDLESIQYCASTILPDNTLETTCRKVHKDYFDCISFTARGNIYVEIYAETYCAEIIECL